MRFKIGFKKPVEEEKVKMEEIKDIFIQNQVKEGEVIPINPPKFDLCWSIEYKNGEEITSQWTPLTASPSITKTMAQRSDGEKLFIKGRSRTSCFEVDLVTIKYNLVNKFGYIGEQTASSPGKEIIIGIWIELTENRIIKIYRNGLVKESIK
jgi:hypothetical protein